MDLLPDVYTCWGLVESIPRGFGVFGRVGFPVGTVCDAQTLEEEDTSSTAIPYRFRCSRLLACDARFPIVR